MGRARAYSLGRRGKTKDWPHPLLFTKNASNPCINRRLHPTLMKTGVEATSSPYPDSAHRSDIENYGPRVVRQKCVRVYPTETWSGC